MRTFDLGMPELAIWLAHVWEALHSRLTQLITLEKFFIATDNAWIDASLNYLRRWTNFIEVKTVFSESCSQTWTCQIKDRFEEISRTWPIFVQLCCPWAGDSDLFLFFADPAELGDSPGTPSGSMLPSKGRMKSCILYMYMVSCMYDHNLCSSRICVFGTTCYLLVHFLSFSHISSYWWVVESCFTLAVFQTNSFKKRLLNSMIGCPSFSTILLPNLG